MSKLTFVGRPDIYTAYGRLSIALLRGMVKAGLDVDVRLTARQPSLPDDIAALCKSGIRYGKAWELVYHPPNILPTPNHQTIYKTTFESTRLSPMSVKCLNAARAVIVPSQWNATIASANGVTVPIFVVPDGIDTSVFRYQPMPQRKAFAFACAGRTAHGEQRKGVGEVIRLFLKAFPTEPDVRLWVKTMPDDPLPAITDSRVQVQARFMEDAELAEWLAACHCFVSLATGAFELMPLEAMAVGRPVISHSFGGVAEYFSEHVGYQVSHTLVPAQDQWKGLGLVAKADDDAVVAAMRHAFADRVGGAGIGARGFVLASYYSLNAMCERTIKVVNSAMGEQLPKPPEEPKALALWRAGKDEHEPWSKQCDALGWQHGVFAFGEDDKRVLRFNPGLCRLDGESYIFPRRTGIDRAGNRTDSRIECWNLDSELNPVDGFEVELGGDAEDGRAFVMGGVIMLSYAALEGSVVRQRVATIGNTENKVPDFGGNLTPRMWEKNWLWFLDDGIPHFIYDSSHCVVEMRDGLKRPSAIYRFSHDWSEWKFGTPRGGTPPVLIGDEYVTLFHSSFDWMPYWHRNRYCIGAYAFESKPPFKITRFTRKPILMGSSNKPDKIVPHANVFVMGATIDRESLFVTAGINDETCGWFRAPIADLQKLMT